MSPHKIAIIERRYLKAAQPFWALPTDFFKLPLSLFSLHHTAKSFVFRKAGALAYSAKRRCSNVEVILENVFNATTFHIEYRRIHPSVLPRFFLSADLQPLVAQGDRVEMQPALSCIPSKVRIDMASALSGKMHMVCSCIFDEAFNITLVTGEN